MALFKKKSTDTPASAADPAATAPANAASGASAGTSTALDDFSDFSPDALDATSTPANGNGKKGKRAKAGKPEKKSSSGRTLKNGTYIGLNIGSDSIKVVELTAKSGELSLTGMGMVPTPPDSISNGVVMSVNALSNAIRDALGQAGIKSKKVVTSVSGTGALVVRIIEVPKMSDSELEDNMKMDADRYIPFPPSEVIMDFKALRDLPSDPDAMNMEVLLAAAQREIIDLHVQVIQDAKLDPRAIDVEPLSAARALTHPLITGTDLNAEADYNDVAAILNIGASGTEISILRGDLLVFTRSVPTGGGTLTQAIVDTLGLAWHDAEELKREMGDALPPYDTSTPAGSGLDIPDYNAPTTQTGGADDDWSEFGGNDETTGFDELAAGNEGVPVLESNTGQTNAADFPTTDAPGVSTEPAATDPFDDAFFNQGPQNKEPGEQHQQKEAAGDNAPAGGGSTPEPGSASNLSDLFRFDEVEEPDEELPTVDESAPLDYKSLLGEEEDDLADLPTLTSDAPTPTPMPSAFDFPTEISGASSTTGATPTPSPAAGAVGTGIAGTGTGIGTTPSFEDASDAELPTRSETEGTESIFGASAVDDEEVSLLPSEAEPQRSGESPFTFTGETVSSPTATPTTETTPTTGASFGFDFTPPEEAATPATAPKTAPADDPFAAFDLSGAAPGSPTPPAEAATAATGVTSTSVAPELGAAAVASTTAAASDDFDLDTLFAAAEAPAAPAPTDATAETDFGAIGGPAIGEDVLGGFEADEFGDDFSSFGAGLGGAGTSEIDAQTLYSITNPVLENLVSEVRRSLEYHTTRYPDAAVRRVTLIGGGAKLKNLDAYFTQSLGIPTTVGNAAAHLPVKAPKLPPGYVEENGPLFTVAIGLALRELTR